MTKNNLLFYILGVIALFLLVSVAKDNDKKSKKSTTKEDATKEHIKQTTPASVLDKSANNSYTDADGHKWQNQENPQPSTDSSYYDKMQQQAQRKQASRLYTN